MKVPFHETLMIPGLSNLIFPLCVASFPRSPHGPIWLLCVVLVAQLCLTLCDPMDYSLQDLLSMGFPRQEY